MTQTPSPQKIQNSWLPVRYEVIKRVAENVDTVSLTLTPKGEEKLSAAQPGQFNMLYIPGFGEIPVSYSHIDPDSHSLTHTIRAAGTVSTAACARKNTPVSVCAALSAKDGRSIFAGPNTSSSWLVVWAWRP